MLHENKEAGSPGRASSKIHKSMQAVNIPKEQTYLIGVTTLKNFSGILFLFKNKLKTSKIRSYFTSGCKKKIFKNLSILLSNSNLCKGDGGGVSVAPREGKQSFTLELEQERAMPKGSEDL